MLALIVIESRGTSPIIQKGTSGLDMRTDQYPIKGTGRNRRAFCLELVKVATSREARIIQREMAAEWLKLADMVSAAGEPAES